MQRTCGVGAALVAVVTSATASAQSLPPLPPPPPPPLDANGGSAAPAGGANGLQPAAGTAPAGPAGAPSAPAEPPAPPPPPPGPPPVYPYATPPPGRYVVVVGPMPEVHAPRYSLWAGARAGLLAYSGGLYINNQNTGAVETTGNFIRPGLGLELDVGARLAGRYIPYVGYEYGFVQPGHRFEGATADTTAHTSFLGIGFRYMAGDIDSVAFASDLSFGVRTFSVTSGGSTWQISGLEIFRLGLGAEVRINDRFTVSPMVTLSGGSLSDTSGNVSFAPNQGDGMSGPPFNGSGNVPGWARTSYYAVFVGCGAHVDLFGR
jgi:hypothetical protein